MFFAPVAILCFSTRPWNSGLWGGSLSCRAERNYRPGHPAIFSRHLPARNSLRESVVDFLFVHSCVDIVFSLTCLVIGCVIKCMWPPLSTNTYQLAREIPRLPGFRTGVRTGRFITVLTKWFIRRRFTITCPCPPK